MRELEAEELTKVTGGAFWLSYPLTGPLVAATIFRNLFEGYANHLEPITRRFSSARWNYNPDHP